MFNIENPGRGLQPPFGGCVTENVSEGRQLIVEDCAVYLITIRLQKIKRKNAQGSHCKYEYVMWATKCNDLVLIYRYVYLFCLNCLNQNS